VTIEPLRLRLRVRLRRHGLDHQLAAGLEPASSAELRLRARQLEEPAVRRRLARSLRGAVADARGHPAGCLRSAAVVDRRAVIEWGEGLLGLADALEQPKMLNPCGLARTVELITDGAGPLYNPGALSSLGDQLFWVADGLQAPPPETQSSIA
jgi:hypothetical protein